MITIQLQLLDHWTKEPVADADVAATLKVRPRWQRYAPSSDPSAYAEVSIEDGGDNEVEIFDGRVTNLGSGTYSASFDIAPQFFERMQVDERSGPVYDDFTASQKAEHRHVDRLAPAGTVEVAVAVAGERQTFPSVVQKYVLYRPEGDLPKANLSVDFISRGNDLIVAAVGDSIMWGQGLKEGDKFVNIARREIGDLLGRRGVVKYYPAHSGAAISAAELLTAGSAAEEASATNRRQIFADTFPTLFPFDADKQAFVHGRATEALANGLHGEIPRALPTIRHQLSALDDKLGNRVDVLLIDGGMNDVDFEEFLASSDREYQDRYDLLIEKAYSHRVEELLRNAIAKCPHAVIIVTGYYLPFSEQSATNGMESLFDFLGQLETPKLIKMALLPTAIGYLVVDALIDSGIEDAIKELASRARWGQSRAHYWLAKTVRELREAGRPVIFANPGFRPDNAIFAPKSLIHQEFDVRKLKDDARVVRRDTCPRSAQLDQMQMVLNQLGPLTKTKPSAAVYKALLQQLDGPLPLLKELEKAIRNPADTRVWSSLSKELKQEVDRIKVCLMGSFVHPNKEGAAQYAKAIVEGYKRYLRLPIGEHMFRLAHRPAELRRSVRIGEALRSYKLEPRDGLRIAMLQAIVDVVAIAVTARCEGSPDSFKLYLRLGENRIFRLDEATSRRVAAGGETGFGLFTVDTFGDLELGDVKELTLALRVPGHWTLESLTLSFNGREVFKTSVESAAAPDGSVRLEYPSPPLWRPRCWTSDERIPNQQSGATPALAAFGELLHMVHLGEGSDLWHSTFDGNSWSRNVPIPNQFSKAAPALAAFGGRLHLVHPDGRPSHEDLWHSTFDGTSWSPNVRIPNQYGQAALATFGERLHLVSVDGFSKKLWHSTFDGTSWSPSERIPDQSSRAAPALAAFGERLHLVHLDSEWNDLWHSTFDGTSWSPNARIWDQSSKATPALTVLLDEDLFGWRLHMVYLDGYAYQSGASYFDLWHSTFDGTSWSPAVRIPSQYSKAPPTSTAFGGRLHLVHIDSLPLGVKGSSDLWHASYGDLQP